MSDSIIQHCPQCGCAFGHTSSCPVLQREISAPLMTTPTPPPASQPTETPNVAATPRTDEAAKTLSPSVNPWHLARTLERELALEWDEHDKTKAGLKSFADRLAAALKERDEARELNAKGSEEYRSLRRNYSTACDSITALRAQLRTAEADWKGMAGRLAQRLRSLPENGVTRFPDARDRAALKEHDKLAQQSATTPQKVPTGEELREAAEAIAQSLWGYFHGGSAGSHDEALWFANNKSLGGPAHVIERVLSELRSRFSAPPATASAAQGQEVL